MAEIKGLYLWKNGMSKTVKSIMVASSLVLLIMAAGAAYYYAIYKPEKQRQEELARQRQEHQNKVDSVRQFYTDTLAGGGVDALEKLTTSIQRNIQKLGFLGYSLKQMSCNKAECSFSFSLEDGRIFNIPDITVMGKEYVPSFSSTTLDYGGVTSGLDLNPLSVDWQENKQADLPGCTSVMSSINVWNSLSDPQFKIELAGMPSSSVSDQELAVMKDVNIWDMLTVTWTMRSESAVYLPQYVAALAKQQFSKYFLISTLDLNEKFILSGELVCKKGI